ncbi:MAG: HDOD domain-containing protein [Planctomycetota bacterium]|nr:HDOD domain-containing protein [Planctomycetota bacterium]
MPTIADILAAAGELKALPRAWQHIDAVLAREAATSEQIAAAVAADPPLAARVLKLANSPLYGFSRRVERLSQAVHMIGTRQLRELALAMAVVDLVQGCGAARALVFSYLRRSLAVALTARSLAQRRREANVERLFVSGLLHDLGWFALFLADAELAQRCLAQARSRGESVERSEARELGFDHAAIGEALLQQWRLPQSLSEPVRWHHAPALASSQRVECALIHVAMVTCELVGVIDALGLTTPLDGSAWDLLGLEPTACVDSVREAEDALAAMIDIFVGAGE